MILMPYMELSACQKQDVELYLRQNLAGPVELHTYVKPRPLHHRLLHTDCHARKLERFAETVASLHPQVQHVAHIADDPAQLAHELGIYWLPALRLVGEADHYIRYYGLPGGYELNSFLRAMELTAGGQRTLTPAVEQTLAAIQQQVHLLIFVTPTCCMCPMAAHLANQFAVANPYYVRTSILNAHHFPDLVKRYAIQGVPKIVVNDKVYHTGIPDEQLLLRLVQQAIEVQL